MLKIGEFSKLCQLPAPVLRYYDEIGLFEPEYVDKFTGYRYYSVGQLPRLNRIIALKNLDLSLTEIQRILTEDVSIAEIRGMLRLKQSALSTQITEAQAKLNAVENRLKQIEKEDKMPDYEAIVKSVDAMKVATIRETVAHVDRMPARCGAMFEALVAWLRTKNTHPTGAPFAIYHNTEYREQDIDVESAFSVSDTLENGTYTYGDFEIVVRDMPEVAMVASTVHEGDFDRLVEAWQFLAGWLENSPYEIIEQPSREFYLNKPGDPPVAEIQYVIQRSA